MFEAYYSRLCVYAMRYVESKDVAEDVVSDTFYKMWQKGDVEISTSIQSYLFQAVYNNCMYYIRQEVSERKKQQQVQKKYENEVAFRLIDDFNDQDSLIIKEVEEAIDEAIKKLPEQSQKVFTLKRYKGFKNKEVALELDISVKTVEMHMTRALSFLKSELSEYCPVLLSLLLPALLS
ncbi:MAG: RNA polymerase sigma-70 factor [Carboxylicivirga sp.]|nr:RNA polymerase sigma-70 factor [Carboxylicivirga sp.]